MISFGPISSRRLGKSLGVNNILPQKVCTYSCVYCQIGLTNRYCITRQVFYDPTIILREVKHHLEKISKEDWPHYLTFVANGEPTLDINLGKSIGLLKTIGIPIAVITNASMLSVPRVRDDLMLSDWVSVKIDSVDESVWRIINRPHPSFKFDTYLQGIFDFSKEFKGRLVTETMLIKDLNDTEELLTSTANLISLVMPSRAYISIPTRPPAIKTVLPPDEKVINYAYQIFREAGIDTDLILGFEGADTGFTGNAFEDILTICSVHPIRKDMMKQLLFKNNADNTTLSTLLHNNLIQKVEYRSNTYYIRKFRS
jgi:wyosine [tRNA(Phe)-imidazoG37] synthetase (radical SAM superfamily)